MLISFLMPVYNKELYLAESIESILEQTYKNIELVMVDDNSKDGSRDVMRHYQKIDKRVRLYFQPKNMGVAFTRNMAKQLAKGKIFCVADADDIAVKDRAKIVAKYFQQNKKIDLMYGAARIIDMGNEFIGTREAVDFSLDRMRKKNTITHSTVAFREGMLWYRHGLRFIDDWYFYLDSFLYGAKFGKVNDVLSFHRLIDDGLTQKGGFSTKKKEEAKKALMNEFKDVDDDLTEMMKKPIHVVRMKAILKAIKRVYKTCSILDVGCNGGYMMKALNKKGYITEGIDIAKNLVNKCIEDGLSVRVKSLFDPIDGMYDIGLVCDVLEHYHEKDAKKAIDNLLRSCRRLIISVPYRHGMYRSETYPDHIQDYTIGNFKAMLPDRQVSSIPIFIEGEDMPVWELITIL